MESHFIPRRIVAFVTTALLGLASVIFISSSAHAAATGSILPTGDGYTLQWTTSTGTTHYTLVDEATCNGLTDYVQTTTVGQRDAYNVSLASVPDGSTITAITLTPCASRVNGGGANPVMNLFYRYDGVNSANAGAYSLTGTTPAGLGSTNFALSKMKTSTTTLQVGAVLSSGTKGARLSRLATVITYTAPFVAPNMIATVSTSTPNDVQLSYFTSGAAYYTIERSFNSTSSYAFLATTTSSLYTDVAPGSGTWWYRASATNASSSSTGFGTADFETLP